MYVLLSLETAFGLIQINGYRTNRYGVCKECAVDGV